MLSRFFLDRPVFAWVIAIILMVAGALAIFNLPIAQYPPIAPPSWTEVTQKITMTQAQAKYLMVMFLPW